MSQIENMVKRVMLTNSEKIKSGFVVSSVSFKVTDACCDLITKISAKDF